MMTLPRIGQLLTKLDRLLDRYVGADNGSPDVAAYRAFLWDGKRQVMMPIEHSVRVAPDQLIGIDAIRETVLRNTRTFIELGKANNVLLWGERGTGKSSLIKSLLTAFEGTALRLVQVYKHDILTIRAMYDHLDRNHEYRFILFIDDLSFEENQTDYKELKTIMDGGLEEIPENLLFYATSNRKHLIPTKFSDNESDEVRPSDTVEEKVSLSDRFGLRLGFYHVTQDTYLEIVRSYAARYGVPLDKETLDRLAVQWALSAGGRNGRIAEQFARAVLSNTNI
jgi:predicted AAA+ superfamily ATPase